MCSFLATAEAPYPTEHSATCRCFLSTNCRHPTLNIWWCNAFFTQQPRGPSPPMIIAFHFATLAHELCLLDSVMMQPFFTYMHDSCHLAVEWCTNTKLATDNSHALIAYYLPKQQHPSNYFWTSFVSYFIYDLFLMKITRM